MTETSGFQYISLERTPCYGCCPVYIAIIYKNGTVLYEGKHFVEKTGNHRGKVDREAVERLERMIIKIGFEALDSEYPAPITCQSSAITTVVINGNTKTIKNEGSSGPKSLQKLENLIDKVLLQARWGENGESWTRITRSEY